MKKTLFRIICLSILLAGCGTTKITSVWKAADTAPRPYKKILVLGLIGESDRPVQQKMENHLANDLNALGYHAVSALQEYGPRAFQDMSERTAIDKLKNSGVNAVITIVLLDKQKERRYVPGNIYYSPYASYHNYFWGYRTVIYSRINDPGYYVTNTRYFWESNFYDMENQKLIYSVQTQSFDPANAESLAHRYGQSIVSNMVSQNILAPAEALPAKP